MNIQEELDDLDMVWEGYKSECDEMIKMPRVDENPIPQECVAEVESASVSRKWELEIW